MSVVKLSSIPTLRMLYKNAALPTETSRPLYPSSATLLDRISLFQGDITKIEVDAIVNAANRPY
ncbi:hypothetical protein JB92DRAFT_550235 [Gautieria morchelliformis]|nr:hypothetical protein JB92DRAFT_550235 [Gautieria morchelliformis]